MINQRLVPIALKECGTHDFERFGQTFYGAMQDREFVPLGGTQDGGADGFNEPEMFMDETTTSFLQISKQATTRPKIRQTIDRLKEFGRNPKVLTYLTSQTVPNIDVEQSKLTRELKCKIIIRDAKFIETNINSSPVIQGAFESFLQPCIQVLYSPGASMEAKPDIAETDRTLAVFLRQEVDNRSGRSSLLESVSDSLILWALRETDPDAKEFLNRQQILDKIETTLPSARQFIRGVIDNRLKTMAAKDAPGGRQIRWYQKDKKYCLPFETRALVATENAEDDILKYQVSCVFEERLPGCGESITDEHASLVVKCCHRTLEKVFETQGLQLAQFAADELVDDELYTDISGILSRVVDEIPNDDEVKLLVRRVSLFVLRGTFYQSSDVERKYLLKLSRTYVLLLLLKNEPKVIEYFKTVANNFDLYLGTDIIIRALSEHYLAPQDQTTLNLLKILSNAGARLILTQKVVEEVASHLRRQMIEFEINYQDIEHTITEALVQYIDRLIIRAYFYSKINPIEGTNPPDNWRDYMAQFADYSSIRNNRGDRDLGIYLVNRFKLEYEDTETMLEGISENELEELTASIHRTKTAGDLNNTDDILAYNDALQVLRVYQKRKIDRENSPVNPFGFKTWWLTQDGKVRRAARPIIDKNNRKGFMMRPDFLLNYIGIAPELQEVRDSYDKIFPTVLGPRLSARLAPEIFHKVLDDANEAAKFDPARATAIISELTEKLKSDNHKSYEVSW